MSLLVGVSGGKIVILTSVDDNAGKAIDDTAEVLVNQRALHIDVAEQDSVQCIVEHHIQSFQGTHGGNLGHAETGAVVAEADVTTNLFAHFVQRLAHDAEVLLCGKGAAEAFGGGAIWHIVQQALTRGANDGDDVSTLAGTGLCLHHILIDIACGDDDVQIGLATLADSGDILLTALATATDTGDISVDIRLKGFCNLVGSMYRQLGDVQFTCTDGLGYGLRVFTSLQHGVAHEKAHALPQETFALQFVHYHIGQGNLIVVDSVDAQQTADGALYGNGGVIAHKILHLVGNFACHTPRVLDFFKIKSYFTLLHDSSFSVSNHLYFNH